MQGSDDNFDANVSELLSAYDATNTYTALVSTGWTAKKPPSEGEPDLPNDLDTLSLIELRQLHGSFGAWFYFISNQAVVLNTTVSMMEKQVNAVRSMLLVSLKDAKNKELRDSYISIHPAFVKIDAEVTHYKTLLEAMELRRKTCQEALSIISRQIAVVLGELEIVKGGNKSGYGY
jgi:hypothetical protein